VKLKILLQDNLVVELHNFTLKDLVELFIIHIGSCNIFLIKHTKLSYYTH